MNQHSTVLRPASPTLDEGLAFARYLDEAAEGFFRFLLGRRSVEIIAAAYIQPDHGFSYQHVTFAERDDVFVGMSSGYTAEQHRRSSDGPLKKAAGKAAFRMTAVATLCAPVLRFLTTYADGDFYLQFIAVDEALRGQGVGSALMDNIEQRARATGSARLCLDVSPRNERACTFYARRGMTVAAEGPKLPFLRPFVVRMTTPL